MQASAAHAGIKHPCAWLSPVRAGAPAGEDLAAQLGVPCADADADPDALRENGEADILRSGGFLGAFVPLLERLCHFISDTQKR